MERLGGFMSNENLKKKWKTKNGLKVEVYAYKEGQDHPYIGAYLSSRGIWVESCWTENLTYLEQRSCCYDLVEVSPYDDFKVDDKVLVSNNGKDWHRRYFAGVSKDDRPLAFCEDSYSWGACLPAITWKYCKKWEEGND